MVVVAPPRCQGLCVGTQKPCRATKHLNADGFCKVHAPDALQCRGVAKSSGVRCRIKWDLNGDQFCQFHTAQASHATFPKDSDGSATPKEPAPREGGEDTKAKPTNMEATSTKTQCLGIAKSTGQRCRIKRDLNEDQLCKHHTNQAPAAPAIVCGSASPRAASPTSTSPRKSSTKALCRGTTKSGKPCKISWDLNADQLCKYHTSQTPPVSATERGTASPRAATAPVATRRAPAATRCRGIAQSMGQRCRISWDLDANGFCQFHARQHQHARL